MIKNHYKRLNLNLIIIFKLKDIQLMHKDALTENIPVVKLHHVLTIRQSTGGMISGYPRIKRV